MLIGQLVFRFTVKKYHRRRIRAMNVNITDTYVLIWLASHIHVFFLKLQTKTVYVYIFYKISIQIQIQYRMLIPSCSLVRVRFSVVNSELNVQATLVNSVSVRGDKQLVVILPSGFRLLNKKFSFSE